MRAAIYARVSTERQERQQTIDSQLVSLRRWAEAEGHALAETHLGLTTLQATQIVKLEEIGQKVPAEPIIKLEAEGSDPIGAIIDKMQ